MILEMLDYKTIVKTNSPVRRADIDFAGCDPSDPSKLPAGWESLRNRRVAAKDIAVGGSDKFYQARQAQLEKNVSDEINNFETVLLVC